MLQLDDIPERPTSHKDASGQAITKQQLMDPFRAVDNLAGISVATLRPNQTIDMHSHRSMHEFFYVLQGQGDFIVNGKHHAAVPGTFVHVAPGEEHGFVATQSERWIFMNVGITTDSMTQ